eukprot:Nk52_evm15s216 gene=Nk52_evmTU15s216
MKKTTKESSKGFKVFLGGLGVLVSMLAFPARVEGAVDLCLTSITPQSSLAAGMDSFYITYAALEYYGKYLEDGVTLTYKPWANYHFDDKSVPLLGLRYADQTITSLGCAGIIGAWNSAVSKQVGVMCSAYGLPQISGASTSPSLSEKKNYPSFVRMVSNDNVALSLQADVVKHYGWKKVAIITTDDAFAYDGAQVFRTRALELDIAVSNFEVVPFGLRRLQKEADVRLALDAILSTDARIIVMTAVPNDAHVVLEEAYKKDMLGGEEGKYMWLGANGWAYNVLKTGWANAPPDQDLVGIQGLGLKFNTEDPEYQAMITGYQQSAQTIHSKTVTTPDLWAPMYWDSVHLMIHSLNETIKRMKALNIDRNCLKSSVFPDNTACQIPDSERDTIYNNAVSNKYNGVKEYMLLLKKDADTYGPLSKQPQVMLIEEFYKTDLPGITARIKLDENGDAFSIFEIVNYQVTGARSNANNGKNSKATYAWNAIGTVSASSAQKVTITGTAQFPGGTASSPVTTATDDGVAAAGASSSSDPLPMYIGAGAGAGALIIICVIIYWRVQVAKREAEMNALNWLIDPSELELQQGGVGAVSKSALSVGQSQKSLGSNATQKTARLRLSCQLCVLHGETYVAKFIVRPSIDFHNRDLIKEMFLLHETRHPNLNGFHGFCYDPPKSVVIQEYCEKGSLEDIILAEEMVLDSVFLFSIASDISKGLAYLHKSDLFCHGHVKPTNCVIDRRWTCKLNDYGLETLADGAALDIESEYDIYRSMLWAAPEIMVELKEFYVHHMARTNERIENENAEDKDQEKAVARKNSSKTEVEPPQYPMDQSADVFALGITMCQMVTRSMPFEHYAMEPEQIVEKVSEGEIDLSFESQGDEKCPPLLQDLIIECCSFDPEERPSAKNVSDQITKMNPNKGSLTDNMAKMLENYAKNLEKIVADRTAQLAEQSDKVQTLLYEMLPREVADKLIMSEKIEPESFDCATIFFSDIVGFTKIAAQSTPIQVVDLLNMLYTSFDSTLAEWDVYKVETIGDAYMVVSGIPNRNGNEHVRQIALVSLHLMANVTELKIEHLPGAKFEMRVGVHSGFCVAGVVGIKMPRYCLFGDTVQTASRMESGGVPQRIQISDASVDLLQKHYPTFKLQRRGIMEVKGKGSMTTYWVQGEQNFTRALPVPPPIPDDDLQ